MTNPAGLTARSSPTRRRDDRAAGDGGPRARAELMALLAGTALAPGQRSRPVPHFFPDHRRDAMGRPSPRPSRRGDEAPPEWLQRAASGGSDPQPSRRQPSADQRPRRRTRSGFRRSWLALAAAVAISAAGGLGLFYLLESGHDMPGPRPLALLGNGLRSLLPASVPSGKADPADLSAAGVSRTAEQQPPPIVAAASRKPVRTAHLEVADAAGKAMDHIPLQLAVTGLGNSEDMVLRFTGLPATATLSAGTRQADGTWQIAAGATPGLRLLLSAALPQPLAVEVAALDGKTGDLAAPAQAMKVSVSGPAPDPQTVARADPSPLDATAILTQGLEAMLAGDVAAARQLFRQALDLGEKRAVAHLGRTYDPVVLARLKVSAPAPDRKQAMAWYRRAIEAGDETARADMAALQKKRKK
jgi:hypothetical protein